MLELLNFTVRPCGLEENERTLHVVLDEIAQCAEVGAGVGVVPPPLELPPPPHPVADAQSRTNPIVRKYVLTTLFISSPVYARTPEIAL
jgi:hypothetical protein